MVAFSLAELTNGLPELTPDERKQKSDQADNARTPFPGMYAQAVRWLSKLDPGVPNPEWYPVIAAIRDLPFEDDAFETKHRRLAYDFSDGSLDETGKYDKSPPDNWDGDDAVDETFDRFPPQEGGIGWRSLRHTVRETIGRVQEMFGEALSDLGEGQTDKASDGKAKGQRRRFQGYLPHEFLLSDTPKWIVDEILQVGNMHVLTGAFGSFKTFLLLELLAATAYGFPAFGKFKVWLPGDVVLFCAEAPHDLMRVRWPAWCAARGVDEPFPMPDQYGGIGRILIVPAVPRIQQPGDIDEAIREIQLRALKPVAIGVDTWTRAMGSLNQNEVQNTTLLFENMEKFREVFGCAVVLTHHPKKEDPRSYRGAGEGEADVLFSAEKTNDTQLVQLSNIKRKGFDLLDDLYFQGKKYPAKRAFDQHGGQRYSLAFDAVAAPRNGAVNDKPTKNESRKAAADRLNRDLRQAVFAVFHEHKMLDRDAGASTFILADLVCAKLHGGIPDPRLNKEAHDDWIDSRATIVKQLDYRSSERSQVCAGQWKAVAAGERTQRLWFLQKGEDVRQEYKNFVDLLTLGDQQMPQDETDE